ncbi:hypothetical protein [Vibrio porteresiae]|uniref:Uncharacterized protein n=1 Tax=Vibrio porteresiae DSM 19223 TaxID=1123496 RepID=A0ABZ0QKJ0_9VIBR|nr:hypothetical protein [Vibrio porteresiae]WPC76320.1 hypothetical protein R8Z52_17480 [Vibrio porteresiae DSM 19223]
MKKQFIFIEPTSIEDLTQDKEKNQEKVSDTKKKMENILLGYDQQLLWDL